MNPSILYATIPGFSKFLAGADGSIWSSLKSYRYGYQDGEWHQLTPKIDTHPRTGRKHAHVYILGDDGRRHTRKVHHLILLAFVGPCPPGQRCRHLDGNSLHNWLSDLCWGTHAEDQDDKRRHGTFKPPRIKIGEENGSKLTEQDVLDMRADHAAGRGGYGKLATRYGVVKSIVAKIIKRRLWRHI